MSVITFDAPHRPHRTINDVGEALRASLEAINAVHTMKKVYPAYLTFQAKKGLLAAMEANRNQPDDQIIAAIGDVETLQGGSSYGLTVTDYNGTRYRLTLSVEE